MPTRDQEKQDLMEIIKNITMQLEENSNNGMKSGDLKTARADAFLRLKEIETQEDVERFRAEEQKREIDRMKELCELGSRFQKRRFETFDPENFKRQYAMCRNFCDKFPVAGGKGIYLYGSAGTGKTHLAAAIANDIIENKHKQVVFVNHITLLNRIRKSFDSGEDITTWYKQSPLLIIDDLGKSKVTDWTREVIYDIVNYRYEHELSIIFTSNHDLTDLAAMIGPATASRIGEMCFVLEMSGEDRRLKE